MLFLSGLILIFLHHGLPEWQDYFPHKATQTPCHPSDMKNILISVSPKIWMCLPSPSPLQPAPLLPSLPAHSVYISVFPP